VKTPFYDLFKELGATFTRFYGWQLPLSFTSPLKEAKAVREKAGLFDVSPPTWEDF